MAKLVPVVSEPYWVLSFAHSLFASGSSSGNSCHPPWRWGATTGFALTSPCTPDLLLYHPLYWLWLRNCNQWKLNNTNRLTHAYLHPPLLPPILFPSSSSLSLSFLQLHWRENPKSKPKLKCRPTSSILPGPLVPTYNSLSSLMLLSYDLKTDYKSNIHLKKKLFKLYWSGEGKKKQPLTF